MKINDWTKFTKRIPIKADPQIIYDCWGTQAGLEKWFLRKAEFTMPNNLLRPHNAHIQKEDRYEWLWYGYPKSVSERNIVTDANGKDLFQFKFSGDSLVTVTIKTDEGEQIVELVQENIPLDDNPVTSLYIGCGTGWTFYLANLKSVLEGGIDLRNRNVKLSNVINA